MRDGRNRDAWAIAVTRGLCLALALVLLGCLLGVGSCKGAVDETVVYPKNWPVPGLTVPPLSKRAPVMERTGPDRYKINGVVMPTGELRFGVGFKHGGSWTKVSEMLNQTLKNLGYTQRRGPGSTLYYGSRDRTIDVRVMSDPRKSNHYTILVDVYDKPQTWMISR